MFVYPHIDPVALKIGPLSVHWYGIMYLLGAGCAWCLAWWRTRRPGSHWTTSEFTDLIFYAAIGVIVGGRLGYMLFYNPQGWLAEPLLVFKIWQGGMSFHGGLLGVVGGIFCYARQTQRAFGDVADFITPLVPIGLGLGRLGNFINGELWGRVTDAPWAMVFPFVDAQSRHPSQLYEFFFEGVLLFLALWIYSAKPRPRYAVMGFFLVGYGVLRFIVEFWREPDPQWGFLAWHWLTMGQLLSLPMVAVGAWLLITTMKKESV